jgi:transposase-like protein
VIVVAVRWYLRYSLSYRDVEELLLERGVEVDHVTVYRWVQRFTPLLADAARFTRHAPGDRWFVDETYVKVSGVWRYVYRAVDQHDRSSTCSSGARRDAETARRFFQRALTVLKVTPSEVVIEAAPVYPAVLDELVPSAWHHVQRHANNPIEADHGCLKSRLRPVRGLRTDRTAQVIIAGHAFLQNLRRGQYELGVDTRPGLRVATALDALAQAIEAWSNRQASRVHDRTTPHCPATGRLFHRSSLPDLAMGQRNRAACPTVTRRNCSPSVASTSTT